MPQTDHISLTDCVYFPSYVVKCIFCFMLRHLMTSWNLKIQNSKIWFSRARKEFLKLNKKTFFLVCQVLPFRLKKQTSKNVADITLKWVWPFTGHQALQVLMLIVIVYLNNIEKNVWIKRNLITCWLIEKVRKLVWITFFLCIISTEKLFNLVLKRRYFRPIKPSKWV